MANNEKNSEFNKILNSIDYSKSKVTVFADFLSLSAYSIAQPFYKSQELEEKYLAVAKTYKPEQLQVFAKLLALVVDALEEEPQDFLGTCFMQNDMGSQYKGQFFTPFHVSSFMAEITLGDVTKEVEEKGFITISEPCSGAGGMIIACREVFIKQGCNPSTQMFVEAVDIDDLCFKMSYIQLSLLGIPARVIRGNTLSLEYSEVLYTPVYFLNGWYYKLNRQEPAEIEAEKIEENTEVKEIKIVQADGIGQLSLF